MKKTIILLITSILSFGCSENQNLENVSFEIAQNLKKGNFKIIKANFYSKKYYQTFENIDNSLSSYQSVISELKIDRKENIILDTASAIIENPFLPKDTLKIFSCHVPIGISISTKIPEYFLFMRFINKSGEYKLIALDLKPIKNPKEINNIEIQDNIIIKKERINNISLMYEGGYKEPMVFKRNRITFNMTK